MIKIVERDRRAPHGWGVGVVGGLSACAAGDLEAVRRLASEGWAAAHAVDKHWNTALQWAAGGGHLAVVRWLVEDMKVDVDAKNKVGRTALMWACKAGSSQVASYLLNEADADASLRMKDDSTAFDWAVRCSVPSGHSSVQQMISLYISGLASSYLICYHFSYGFEDDDAVLSSAHPHRARVPLRGRCWAEISRRWNCSPPTPRLTSTRSTSLDAPPCSGLPPLAMWPRAGGSCPRACPSTR